MQETWVQSLVQEDLTCLGTKSCAIILLSLCSQAQEPQLLEPVCLEPMLCNKRNHHNEKTMHCGEELAPLAATREKPTCSNKDPTLPKMNQLSHSAVSDSLQHHGLQHSQASLSITNSWSLLKLISIKSAMPSNHLILCRPFCSCLQSFPASGSYKIIFFKYINTSKVLFIPWNF